MFKSWKSLHLFDNADFPGVVPRTFIGPLILSLLSRIPIQVANLSSVSSLLFIRALLATFVVASFMSIRISISRVFSTRSASFFVMFTLAQFHLAYYSSRTLPNIFALILTNFALADFLLLLSNNINIYNNTSPYQCIALLATAVALFRSELVLLLFPTLLCSTVFKRKLSFITSCIVALISAVFIAFISILIDSYFWQKLTYPEFEVFIFNAVKGGSAAWGTLPFHWYFTNAIPRSILFAFPLALLGASGILNFIKQQQHLSLIIVLFPALFFVALYSALPHKELRFVFYAIPYFNVCASVTVDIAFDIVISYLRDVRNEVKKDDGDNKPITYLSGTNKIKVMSGLFIISVGILSIIASTLQTGLSLTASSWNYSSGHALQWLICANSKEEQFLISQKKILCDNHESNFEVPIHIDVDSAMNGISQFVYRDLKRDGGHPCIQWTYSKDENVGRDDEELKKRFLYLLTERKYIDGFQVIHAEQSFQRFNWRKRSLVVANRTYVQKNLDLLNVLL